MLDKHRLVKVGTASFGVAVGLWILSITVGFILIGPEAIHFLFDYGALILLSLTFLVSPLVSKRLK